MKNDEKFYSDGYPWAYWVPALTPCVSRGTRGVSLIKYSAKQKRSHMIITALSRGRQIWCTIRKWGRLILTTGDATRKRVALKEP
ncbi:Uncharacterized protein HZ326_31774 [Fusarium oxysporum f. sp. albedinis]|nr:Uncharacterized protein HZ326_31774 [Fusarium oxysporum f. sp. albedinis]